MLEAPPAEGPKIGAHTSNLLDIPTPNPPYVTTPEPTIYQPSRLFKGTPARPGFSLLDPWWPGGLPTTQADSAMSSDPEPPWAQNGANFADPGVSLYVYIYIHYTTYAHYILYMLYIMHIVYTIVIIHTHIYICIADLL